MKTTKLCITCHLPFVDSKHPHKRACSRKCAGLFKRKNIITKRCPTCNKEFTSKNKFCSIACARPSFASRRGKILTKITKNCIVCGKQFATVPSSSKQFCCSQECRTQRLRKPLITKTCEYCNKIFTTSRKTHRYCSRRCGSLHRFVGYIRKTDPAKTVPRTQMIECDRCGFDKYPEILERHHKDRNHSNNDPINIEVVCPNCHSIDHLLAKDGKFKAWLSIKKGSQAVLAPRYIRV